MTNIYGNKTAINLLEKIIDSILKDQLKSGFFLLCGPSNIGKKTVLLDLINKLGVSSYDFLKLEDPGKIDNSKIYNIRIDVPDKEKFLKIGDKTFLNLGARQILDFLSTTSFGKFKIVFIENIERLNISASNALLKKLEEPGNNMFIFATTSNKRKLLSTILSRAYIINFTNILFEDFELFLRNNFPNIDEKKGKILYAITGGRIGLVKKMLNENDNLLSLTEKYLELDKKTENIFPKYNLFKKILQTNDSLLFIDGLIYYYSSIGKFDKVCNLVVLKQKKQSNINLENLLFEYILKNTCN